MDAQTNSYLTVDELPNIGSALLSGYQKTRRPSAVSVFLCGGRMDDQRFARPRFFQAVRHADDLIIRTPEGLFDDLLEKRTYDLLGLEELLADSVDVIVIFPESPGSFAELGAFSGNPRLREKTICVSEMSFKSSLSFINVGPVKILKNVKRNRVIYFRYDSLGDATQVVDLAGRIVTVARAIRRTNPARGGLFLLEDLLTLALYCLESASTSELKRLFKADDIGVEPAKFDRLYNVCLSTLATSNKVEKDTAGRLSLSRSAAKDIVDGSTKERIDMLRAIRVDVMNSILRRHAETKSVRMQRLLP